MLTVQGASVEHVCRGEICKVIPILKDQKHCEDYVKYAHSK